MKCTTYPSVRFRVAKSYKWKGQVFLSPQIPFGWFCFSHIFSATKHSIYTPFSFLSSPHFQFSIKVNVRVYIKKKTKMKLSRETNWKLYRKIHKHLPCRKSSHLICWWCRGCKLLPFQRAIWEYDKLLREINQEGRRWSR